MKNIIIIIFILLSTVNADNIDRRQRLTQAELAFGVSEKKLNNILGVANNNLSKTTSKDNLYKCIAVEMNEHPIEPRKAIAIGGLGRVFMKIGPIYIFLTSPETPTIEEMNVTFSYDSYEVDKKVTYEYYRSEVGSIIVPVYTNSNGKILQNKSGLEVMSFESKKLNIIWNCASF